MVVGVVFALMLLTLLVLPALDEFARHDRQLLLDLDDRVLEGLGLQPVCLRLVQRLDGTSGSPGPRRLWIGRWRLFFWLARAAHHHLRLQGYQVNTRPPR
jgi:hypothetical protein